MCFQIVLVAPGAPEARKHEQAAYLKNVLRERWPQARVSLCFCAEMQSGGGAFGAQSAHCGGIVGETLFLPLFVVPGQEFLSGQAGFPGTARLEPTVAAPHPDRVERCGAECGGAVDCGADPGRTDSGRTDPPRAEAVRPEHSDRARTAVADGRFGFGAAGCPALLQSRFARAGLAAGFSARYRSFLNENGMVIYLAHGSELPAAASCLQEFAAELQRRDRRQFLFSFSSAEAAAAGLRRLRPGRVKLVPLTVFCGAGVADVLDSRREMLIKRAGGGIECATERIGLIERDFACQIWLQLFEAGAARNRH